MDLIYHYYLLIKIVNCVWSIYILYNIDYRLYTLTYFMEFQLFDYEFRPEYKIWEVFNRLINLI